MRTVTVRRGERLPENVVGGPLIVRGTAVYPRYELKPGDEIPLNALEDSYTVEVRDDPSQAYLIVPCETAEATHRPDPDGIMLRSKPLIGEMPRSYKQIPCALTLEDLRVLSNRRWESGSALTDELQAQEHLAATIAAWAAVPQPKEAANV